MKKRNSIFSLLLAVCLTAGAIPVTVSAEEKVTPSGIPYDQIGKKIEEFTAEKSFPSYRVEVFCGDEILYEGGRGYVDKDKGIVTDENTVYEWGSVTKTLVWVSVLQLYEQGKIDFNADVRDYLPADFVKRLKYQEAITMLDLMNHTAGFEESVRNIQSNEETNIRTLPEALLDTEPNQVFPPGEVTSYSNWGAALAGYVVACISGEEFADYVQKHIFEPAGMEHTSIAPDHSDNPWVRERRKEIYSYQALGVDGETMLIPCGKQLGYIELYPAGSAAGTVSDLAKYGQALVSDDCPFFEKQETAELLLSASSFLGDTEIPKSCHGFWCTDGAVRYLGHNGATLGFTANLQFDRVSKLGCAVVVNQYLETEVTAGIPALLFGEPDDSSYEKAKAVPADLAGTYIQSRGHLKNGLRALSYVSVIRIKSSGNNEFTVNGEIRLRPLENGLVLLTADESSMLGERSADGTHIGLGASEWVRVKGAGVLQILVFGYIGVAAAGFIAVITLWMVHIINKRKKFYGVAVICVSHMAKVVSCLCFLAEVIVSQKNMGLPLSAGVLSAVIQTVCVVLYVLAVISDGRVLIKEKRGGGWYCVDAAGNVFAAVTVILFGGCGL